MPDAAGLIFELRIDGLTKLTGCAIGVRQKREFGQLGNLALFGLSSQKCSVDRAVLHRSDHFRWQTFDTKSCLAQTILHTAFLRIRFRFRRAPHVTKNAILAGIVTSLNATSASLGTGTEVRTDLKNFNKS